MYTDRYTDNDKRALLLEYIMTGTSILSEMKKGSRGVKLIKVPNRVTSYSEDGPQQVSNSQ